MRKDKKHCRKNSNDQSDSASTSDEESLSQRLHETSLFSQHNQHHHRHSRDEHRHAIRTADYASRYGEEPLNTEQPPYEDSDASMHASQTRYQPSQTYRATGQSRYDEEVSESRNNATFGSVMSEYEEGHSQEYGRSQQNFAPRQSYERPTYDEGNYAMLGAGMPQSEGPSEEYGQPQQNYASQRRYGPSQSYGETERPGYGKQMPDSRNNATFDSGMPQYEDRYQEYGQPQQNYALQYPSYETSVPPSRYQPPQQQMPQIAQYEQPPSRSSESADYSDRGQMPIESPGKAGSIPASDSSIIGPFVRFRTVDLEDGEHGTWIGSVLIVTNTSGILPSMELVAESGDDRPFRLPASKPVPLDAHQDQIFYRFEVRVPLFRDQEQTVAARIAFGGENPVEARFSIAGSTTPLRMAFYSCNGVSSDCTDEAIWKSPDSLWNDVLAKHEAKPFHFMIGGGDQIYCDPVWTDVPECKDWIEKSLPDRIQSSFPEQAKLNIENFYFENYRKLFNSGKYSQGLRAIPSIMVIDDHDIFDGVGTYPENLRSCPFMWGVARIGYRFFLLFQQHTTPEHSAEHGFFGAEGSHNFVAQLNRELAVVGADGRRERRLDQIMHPDSYEMMREELNRLAPSTLHLLAVLGVPILYPRLTLAENILQCVHGINSKLTAMSFLQKSGAFQAIMGPLGDQPELMDDLGDHWTAPPHETERLRFIEQMQNFARDRSVRVTFVSGDVHCCGVGRFKGTSEAALEDIKKDPNFMLQIISSGIQNVPPPAMVISALHQCSSKIKVNSSSEEEMVDLFGRDAVGNKSLSGNHKLLNRRNWTTIDQDGSGNVKFKIRVEAYSGSGIIGGAYGVVAPPLEI